MESKITDFKFILFTERVFKNKPVFILAKAYDYLCAIAYVCDNKDFIDHWRMLSEEVFHDLLLYDSNQMESIPKISEYIELMKKTLDIVEHPSSLIEQTNVILSSY